MNPKHHKPLLFGITVLAFLSACGITPEPGANNQKYILTLDIATTDTQAALESKYHATTLAFDPQARFAMLSSTQKPSNSDPMVKHVAADTPTVSLDPSSTNDLANTNPGLQDTTSAIGGNDSWGAGWTAWSGGWGAWSGGTTSSGGPSQELFKMNAWVQIKLFEAHRISRKFGEGIKVAVVDTGLDTTHPMFSGRLAPASEWKDFVDGDTNPQDVSGGEGYGHGTAVAGIIWQVAPKATILPIRVLKSDGSGLTSDVVAGIAHAISKGAQVINVSIGTTGYDQSLFDICAYANSKNVYITASVGNSGTADVTSPAQFSWNTATKAKTIGIGSVKIDDTRSPFSNYGSNLYAWAPGYGIWTAMPNGQIGNATGTSFAAPMFAGAIALAQSETPNVADRTTIQTPLWNGMDLVNASGSGQDHRLNLEGVIRSLSGWVEPKNVLTGVYSLVSTASTKCVDVYSGGNNVQLWACNGGNNQRWKIEPVGSYFKLTAMHSGKVLEVNGGSTADGANVDQTSWVTNATNQLWTLRYVSGGMYELVNQKSGKCLDVAENSWANGTNIQQLTCKDTKNQRYLLNRWF